MRIKLAIIKFVSAITFMAMLSGCADTADGRKTQAQGAGIGAGGGALLGGLIGYATGGSQGAARGALAGAALGGAAGFAYGTHVAHQKAKYASAEAWLNACIASASKANRRAYAYNESLNNKIARLAARSKAARASGDKVAAAQIRTEIVQLKSDTKAQIQQVDGELKAQAPAMEDRDAKASSAYNSEIKDLRSNEASMSNNLGRLASLENQVNI